jgi:hypothetical protein
MRLRAMHELACANGNVGRCEESFALVEETYRLMKAKLGPDHPQTLNCLRNVALAYAGQSRYAEAVSNSKQDLSTKQKFLSRADGLGADLRSK